MTWEVGQVLSFKQRPNDTLCVVVRDSQVFGTSVVICWVLEPPGWRQVLFSRPFPDDRKIGQFACDEFEQFQGEIPENLKPTILALRLGADVDIENIKV